MSFDDFKIDEDLEMIADFNFMPSIDIDMHTAQPEHKTREERLNVIEKRVKDLMRKKRAERVAPKPSQQRSQRQRKHRFAKLDADIFGKVTSELQMEDPANDIYADDFDKATGFNGLD